MWKKRVDFQKIQEGIRVLEYTTCVNFMFIFFSICSWRAHKADYKDFYVDAFVLKSMKKRISENPDITYLVLHYNPCNPYYMFSIFVLEEKV